MRKFYITIIFLCFYVVAFAQQSTNHITSTTIDKYARTTGSSGTGANIDVDNYQIWWRINPDSTAKGIKGVVTIKFKTTQVNVTAISFDLSSLLTVSQVLFRGAALPGGNITRTGDILNINLGTTIATIGTRDSVTISYSGVPQNGTAGGGGIGYQKTTDPNAGNYIYTLAESFEDRDWWPCKADMQDKADTIDISVNVPYRTNNALAANATDTFWVATNGTLVDSSFDISGTQANRNRTFKFLNRYPMATYLVSVCVAKYRRFYRGTINVNGFNMPVVYYLFAGKTTAIYNTILASMDKVTELVQAFGNKFGNYGFVDPAKGGKHGFYEGLGTFGGMEHQTFSGISTNSLNSLGLLAHELAHQWFGDKVSFSTWSDLWLAEGFAKYSESLAAELVTGMGYTPYADRNGVKGVAINNANRTTSTYIPPASATNSDLIWGTGSTYASTIYNRGAMVVSMLRTMSGDAKFFQALTNYQTDPALEFKSASTDNLKQHFNNVLGVDLTEFFNDNIYGTGNAVYNIGYQLFGTGNKNIGLTVLSQTKNPVTSPVTYFNNPIVVHLKGSLASQDTTIVFYDWGGGNLSKAGTSAGIEAPIAGNKLFYTLSFTPTTFAFDDSARTMSTGSMSIVTTLDLQILDFAVRQHNTFNDAILTLDDNTINAPVYLQRSTDGVNFEQLGQMLLQNSNGSIKRYAFNDLMPLLTNNYYRATYNNASGVTIYSKIVKIGGFNNGGFAVLNNPVKALLQIKTISALGKAIQFAVYDATGKQILLKAVENAGNITDINLPNLSPGMYFVKISTNGLAAENLKFLVK
ncbi:M1 family aminopeptidase [Ferruginibacter yonginensis]|uniref:Aminopeptidase N n=1 Tax=Ferruginibacter yonginensis TaxID=1310416 RepID=A0ABV8QS07_9BACT